MHDKDLYESESTTEKDCAQDLNPRLIHDEAPGLFKGHEAAKTDCIILYPVSF